MRLINLYLSRNIAVSLAIAIAISTFVLLMGQFSGVFELLTRGVRFRSLLLYVALRIPQAVGFTIPLGIFVATVLVFNRMSSENEITALRATGISLYQILAPLVILSVILSAVCFLLNMEMAPEFKYKSKIMIREEGVQSPLLLVDAGRFVEIFGGYVIYVGKKEDNSVWDIHLYILNEKDAVQQKIYAQRGLLKINKEYGRLDLTLYDTMIETTDPKHPYNVLKNRRIKGKTLTFPLDYASHLGKKRLGRSVSEMTLPQLFARIQIYTERGVDTSAFYIELHKRAAMALSPFSFMLIGLPMGIRLPRKESNWGMIVCFIVPFAYYILISFIESLHYKPEYHPELLMWIPNLACQLAGLTILWMKR